MDDLLERGVAELIRSFGEAAYQLQRVQPKSNEYSAFSFTLPEDYEGLKRDLRIGIPKTFPYLPLTFTITPSALQQWPHVMKSGVCLYTGNQPPPTTSPEEAVSSSMRRLSQLIQFSAKGSDANLRKAEFEKEIRSYWSTQLKHSPNRFTLVRLPENSGPIYVVSANSTNPLKSNQYIAASEYDDISKFESRYMHRTSKQKATAQPAFFLKLTTTPSNVIVQENILHWLEGHAPNEQFDALKNWFKHTSDLPMRWLILSLPTDSTSLQGFVFTDINIDANKKHGTLYGRKTLKRKFVTTNIKLNIQFTQIDILDAAIIHHRAGPAAKGLAEKRVIVVGTGSLGGEVAVLLARSGVGYLYLIDYDTLEDVNIGRHALGVPALGKPKVEALAERICLDIPTVEIDYSIESIQYGGKSHLQALEKADLVIVTTANWNSEDYLWSLKSRNVPWGLVQAWSEPHGIIGHILTAPSAGEYDARYMFKDGRFLNRMSEWPDDGVIPLPACGESYIPGGPVALARIAGQTVQHALHQLINPNIEPAWHVLIGNISAIQTYGGEYKGPDIAEGIGSCEFNYPWPEKK